MNKARGHWVCYDADCALCVRWANRARGLLARRGFTLLPLQSPAARAALRLPEEELLTEMRVITNTGRIFGGADALAYLGGAIIKPLAPLTRLPGAMPLLRKAYRFLARHRHCATGACRTRPAKPFRVGNPADWLPLLALVTAAAVIGRTFPAWLYMWVIAAALFIGSKWLCFRRELAKGTRPTFGRKFGFLFGWIGMDAAAFFDKTIAVKKPLAAEWILAALKILLGAALIWVTTPWALTIHPLFAGWTGMIGLIFFLHFGCFHLLSILWRAAGVNAAPLMRAPLLSHSLGEFWGKRWNTAFNCLAEKFLFRPTHRLVGGTLATLFVFLMSGLIHDLIISVPARGGYGLPTLYFLLQGAGILFEHTALARRCGLTRGFRGWLFTLILTAGPAFWLFHPVFIRNVILPFFNCIGAT